MDGSAHNIDTDSWCCNLRRMCLELNKSMQMDGGGSVIGTASRIDEVTGGRAIDLKSFQTAGVSQP